MRAAASPGPTGKRDVTASFAALLAPEDAALVGLFATTLRNGLTQVSPDTVRTYLGELRNFLRLAPAVAGGGLAVRVRRPALLVALAAIPTERASSRRNMFYAVRALARFLRDMDLIEDAHFQAIREMRLKIRHEPRRPALSEDQVERVLRIIASDPAYDDVARITNLAIFGMLAFTGMRNSELCQLCLSDVDFSKGLITIRKGKGGKKRVLGLPKRLVPMLRLYLEVRPATDVDYFFVRPVTGGQFDRDAIIKRMGRIAKKAGFSVAAHMCRRTFATSTAHRGVPLDKLQVLLGHADIQTTRLYVQTPPIDAAIEMQYW